MKDTANEVRKDSNLVAGFLEECCHYDQDMRISAPDFCSAFAAWWKQNKGEDRSRPSNEMIGKALKAMADRQDSSPRICAIRTAGTSPGSS